MSPSWTNNNNSQFNNQEVSFIAYNIKTGQNTVLRGLIAEEFARYTLTQRYPIIMLRPIKVLEYLSKYSVQGAHTNFLNQFQQTMDFIGFGPINEREI